MYPIFFKWAIENGYYRKRYQSYSSKRSFLPPNKDAQSDDDVVKVDIKLDATFLNYDFLPYIDTLSYGDSETISNDDDNRPMCCDDTEGGCSGKSRFEDGYYD